MNIGFCLVGGEDLRFLIVSRVVLADNVAAGNGNDLGLLLFLVFFYRGMIGVCFGV